MRAIENTLVFSMFNNCDAILNSTVPKSYQIVNDDGSLINLKGNIKRRTTIEIWMIKPIFASGSIKKDSNPWDLQRNYCFEHFISNISMLQLFQSTKFLQEMALTVFSCHDSCCISSMYRSLMVHTNSFPSKKKTTQGCSKPLIYICWLSNQIQWVTSKRIQVCSPMWYKILNLLDRETNQR